MSLDVTVTAAGLMSGTSLDGLDMVVVRYTRKENQWSHELLAYQCIDYSDEWRRQLSQAHMLSGAELSMLDVAYGRYLGDCVSRFLKAHGLVVDLIASHGHTVHHMPDQGVTVQIGSGSSLSGKCHVPVICDFRIGDVALGGQGAPLVPIGDRLLFGAYDYCLNLGGFANVSYEHEGHRLAYDLCAVNMALNDIAGHAGLRFDAGGRLARSGRLIPVLFQQLNALDYYQQHPPKSLGREWYEREVQDIWAKALTRNPVQDLLHTYVMHIAQVIAEQIYRYSDGHGRMLVTGGGSHNTYLMEQLVRTMSQVDIEPASPQLIDFKEAIIFAFLGVLRSLGEINILCSVTGASRDSCGGVVYPNH